METFDNAKSLGDEWQKHALTLHAIRKVAVFDQLASTNDQALKMEKDGFSSGTLVVALQQSQGRGRLKRRWLMGEGDVACSLMLRSQHMPRHDHVLLPMVPALAVRDALLELGLEVMLKWPNDIVRPSPMAEFRSNYFYHYQKLGGILVESLFVDNAITACVIGIGLNVVANDEIKRGVPHAGFLDDMLPARRADIVRMVMSRLDHEIEQFSNDDWASSIRHRYEQSCATIGKKVLVVCGDQEHHGQVLGINTHGALVIDDGVNTHALYSGDIKTYSE